MPLAFTSPASKQTPWPTSTAELEPSERLIVWAFRRWVLGLAQNNGGHWSLVWNEFVRQFGAGDGKEAMTGFAKLVKGLHGHARRSIGHHQPCCSCLCADEVSIVCLVAACQHRQPRLARGLAEWLVLPDGAGDLLAAAVQLGHIMRRHGLRLPVRTQARGVAEALDKQEAAPALSQATMH